jgi:hypothetical protein
MGAVRTYSIGNDLCMFCGMVVVANLWMLGARFVVSVNGDTSCRSSNIHPRTSSRALCTHRRFLP